MIDHNYAKKDDNGNEKHRNFNLGVLEDIAHRTRLAKLLTFTSSSGRLTTLAEYVERMKDKQESIYYIAGGSKKEVSSSPFIERLLKRGYEVLFLTEPVDEYAISSLPEFEGKKFQNVTTMDQICGNPDKLEDIIANFDTKQSKKKKYVWVGYCGHSGCDFSARSTGYELSINKVRWFFQ